MIIEKHSIIVPGQKTGPAQLVLYRIDNISVAPDKKRPMIVICGGGGYGMVSDREKEPIALQFLAAGYHACLLEYSVVPNVFPTAAMELGSAVALIRDHADEWNIDPQKIITCGFSAGGHLAASLGVFWTKEFIFGPLGRKAEEIRPNGQILCYPVITSGEYAHRDSFVKLLGDKCEDEEQLELVSLEKQVTADVPITFLWHTVTDQAVPVENSIRFAQALHSHGVNFEMHFYPLGGHGLSLANEETSSKDLTELEPYCIGWIGLAKAWLELNFSIAK
ncbi:MAG: alpha/beta hydrolase [Clostridiales bacterium]|nr:alpha/beta hydrolase [Clostridiales bacterium]